MKVRIASMLTAVAFAALTTAGTAGAYGAVGTYSVKVNCHGRYSGQFAAINVMASASTQLSGQWISARYYFRNIQTGAGWWTNWLPSQLHQHQSSPWPGVIVSNLPATFQTQHGLAGGWYRIYVEVAWFDGKWTSRGGWVSEYEDVQSWLTLPYCITT